VKTKKKNVEVEKKKTMLNRILKYKKNKLKSLNYLFSYQFVVLNVILKIERIENNCNEGN
jgi:hypothetical protein